MDAGEDFTVIDVRNPTEWTGQCAVEIEMNDSAAVMGQHKEYVKDLESDRGHGEEIDRNQLLCMILQEGAPSL